MANEGFVKVIGSDGTHDQLAGRGYIRWNPFTCVTTSYCNIIAIPSAAAKDVRVAIYSDNAGVPNALLAESAAFTAGVRVVNYIPLDKRINLMQGVTYWLAAQEHGDSPDTLLQYVGGALTVYYLMRAFGAFPATAAGSSSLSGYDQILQAGYIMPLKSINLLDRRLRIRIKGVSLGN